MKVKEFMNTRVHVADPEMSLEKALTKMRKNGVRCLIVVDGENRVIGIITDSDILLKGIQKGDLDKVKVSEIMSKDPLCVTPDMGVMDVISLLRKHKYRRAPVVEGDKLVGMVSVSDIAPHILLYMKRLHHT